MADLLTVETKGEHTDSRKSEATFRKLKRTLRVVAASISGATPTEARLDFYDAGVDSRAMPSAKEISRTRSNHSQQSRVEALAETPAEIVLSRGGFVRQSYPQLWEMRTAGFLSRQRDLHNRAIRLRLHGVVCCRFYQRRAVIAEQPISESHVLGW